MFETLKILSYKQTKNGLCFTLIIKETKHVGCFSQPVPKLARNLKLR